MPLEDDIQAALHQTPAPDHSPNPNANTDPKERQDTLRLLRQNFGFSLFMSRATAFARENIPGGAPTLTLP